MRTRSDSFRFRIRHQNKEPPLSFTINTFPEGRSRYERTIHRLRSRFEIRLSPRFGLTCKHFLSKPEKCRAQALVRYRPGQGYQTTRAFLEVRDDR